MISSEKLLELSRQLEDHHAIFYTLWKIGKPVEDKTIPTACINFDVEGNCLEFAFNPDFWDKSTDYDRLFTICHESLHVLLRHGVRTIGMKDPERCTIALDLVVNHMLVNKFGFDRTKVTNWKTFCWVDTVFSDPTVPDNLSYEQYFELVGPCKMSLVDSHSWRNQDSEKIVGWVSSELSKDERNGLKDMVNKHSSGTEPGNVWCFADNSYVPPKKKWETVIKKWAKQFDKTDLRDVEQWSRVNRRYACLKSDFILPSEMEIEHDVDGKIHVWFFQDTSGSCYEHRNRFFKAAQSLPKNRFDVKLHCFDTKVYETSLESRKLFGFGGTAFDPLERYIQKCMRDHNVPYPQAVFVITDGDGTYVQPEKPDRWHWFLTKNYLRCIPVGSKIFKLQDFE